MGAHVKGNIHRLGLGEVTTPDDQIVMARLLFLWTADELYPAMRAELEAIDFEKSIYGFVYEDEAEGPLGAWCKRWRLIDNDGSPARWALQAAYESLANLCFLRRQHNDRTPFVWTLPGGGVWPDRPATMNARTDLAITSLAAAKNHTSRRAQLSAAKAECLDAGWIEARTKRADHFRWAVEHLIGEASYEQIDKRDHADANAVAQRVQEVRRLMEWTQPRGRPPKVHAR